GRVAYDIVAARKRLLAAEEQEQFAAVETLRAAAVQYYDLVLAQIQLANARQAVSEGDELLRITRVRAERGTGLAADHTRARAVLAGRQQDLAVAAGAFYQASIRLATTLHLEPSVTLVPRADRLAPTRLVREDLPIEDLLAIAVTWRPDLRAVRTLADAAGAESGSATWGTVFPQVSAAYQFSGVASDSTLGDFGLHEQNRAAVGASWSFGLATPGQIRTAEALARQAGLEVERQFDAVRAQVVRAAQESATNARLIPMAREQVTAAEESLRLTEANLKAGTVLTLDALQSADLVNDARLRYAKAVAAYNASQVNLLAALGLIDAERLRAAPPPVPPAAPAPTTRPAGE
ncbi:MAG TPA: TolC family protein, partial [Tepidisphaeraceae bacterium]|nr:TolC family protein [Tepidisphaeraceae bacterium]